MSCKEITRAARLASFVLRSALHRFSSSRISAAALRASSTAPIGKLIAPTLGWPPPPYRSQIVARLCFSGSRTQGFDPTETFVRNVEVETETVYADSGNR